MKSLPSAAALADQTKVVEGATPPKRGILARFTDFQWFLYRARNTVYFTAFSKRRFDEEGLMALVERLVLLAPQLGDGYQGARPGEPLPRHILEAITDIKYVDELDDYPDAFMDPGDDLFETKDLPLFRVYAVVRKDGPDAEGRQSAVLVRSSHALMEGADSALLTRSQSAAHTAPPVKRKVSRLKKLSYTMIAATAAPFHLTAAHILSPDERKMAFKTTEFSRDRIRSIATALGVRQRSLMFGLVVYSLYRDHPPKGKVRSAYTTLGEDKTDADDAFFRVRALDANYAFDPDPIRFVQHVDAVIEEAESQDLYRRQSILNAMFGAHRFMSRILPFAYSPRFFRYAGPYDLVLTLVPPHRLYGNLTAMMKEPIYCGSYHSGTSLCTFVPARRSVTFNFVMPAPMIERLGEIEALMDRIEADAPARTGGDEADL